MTTVTSEHDIKDPPQAVSVKELVHRRLSDNDGWHLALVQRDEVWDEVRMRHLLDSLLAGYPIGAILLSRAREGGRELVVGDDGKRTDTAATVGSFQVLDGQQRINAVFSIFTDRGHYGRFLLDMLMCRPDPTPAQGRRAKERALPHIHHAKANETPENRDRLVDLSRWATWAGQHTTLVATTVTAETVSSLLAELDPEFAADLTNHDVAAVAAENLRRLVCAWNRESIPVLCAEVDTPEDVLEVFTRINLGGVAVAGPDVFFAGVKTFWPEAESVIDEILEEVPFLQDRIGAVRFLSRLASRGLGHGDILPLTIDRLSGSRGSLLRKALAEITAPGDRVRTRLRAFSAWYQGASQLGYGLHEVTRELWDDVLAWAASSSRTDTSWYRDNLALLDGYLLGATLFRYRSVLGDRFHRTAFLEALDAGSNGYLFPGAEILAVTRNETRLEGTRGAVVRSLDEPGRDAIANENGHLLIALIQRMRYDASGFDWDHIFPQAQASRMWAPGAVGRRRHHPDRRLINTTGNFWALTAAANRGLGDTRGRDKFETLAAWLRDGTHGVWERARWSLDPEDIENHIRVDELLTEDPVSINQAMELFKSTVTGRAQRLLSQTLERFPEAARFAYDHPAGPESAAEPTTKKHDYRVALDLDADDPTLGGLDKGEALARVRARSNVVGAMIEHRLSAIGQLKSIEQWHPQRTTEAFTVVRLTDGNDIELMFIWSPDTGARIEIKAYRHDDRPGGEGLYPDFRNIPLGPEPGLGWEAADQQIVDTFLDEIARLQESHPAPTVEYTPRAADDTAGSRDWSEQELRTLHSGTAPSVQQFCRVLNILATASPASVSVHEIAAQLGTSARSMQSSFGAVTRWMQNPNHIGAGKAWPVHFPDDGNWQMNEHNATLWKTIIA